MARKFVAKREFSKAYDEIFAKCKEAIDHGGFLLKEADLTSGRIRGTTRAGWRSFGENIDIQVDQAGTVLVHSECTMPTQLVDWGKNRDNVTSFFDNLSGLLDIAPTRPVQASQEVSPSFEILGESNVREYTEIVDTEKLPLDNRYGSDVLVIEHEFSKTVTSDISVETTQQIEGQVGLEFLNLLKAEVAALLSRKIGFNSGESTTRRCTLRFSVKPGDFVIYTIVWKRKVRSGAYTISVGNRSVVLPFDARFGLEYEVTSQLES